MLTFESLSIRVNKWDTDKTPKGNIEFMNNGTKINIALNPEECKAMLVIVADRMVATVQEAAIEMSTDIINAIPTSHQIENKV